MRKEKKVWAITLIALWWLAPNQTNAQQDSVKSNQLNEVVITATKFPKNQVETGKVLTVIDEAQLQQSSGKDIAQLLNEQVGLVINGANSNTGKDKSVFLRGAAGQYTLILMDGIPLSDPSGFGGAFDLRLLPIDQVERIEILKGSQSTLYGTDAIAGVINIITKKKGNKPVGGFGTISYGSYNTFKGNVGVAGSTKIFDYNVGYTRFKTDGISEAKDETGDGNFDKDGFNQNSLQANIGIRPTEHLSIQPFFRYTDYDGKYDGGAFDDDTTSFFKTKLINYGLTGQYALPKGAINLQYGRDDTDREFISAYGNKFKGNFDNLEMFVNHKVGKNLQLLAGLNFQNLKMDYKNAFKQDTAYSNILSPYASFFINNIHGFSAEVGGRYNIHSEFGKVFTYSINPSYLINNQVKIFANYSTGFKAPTLSELYGQYGANENLKPQESNSAEAGIQYSAINNMFDIRATYFDRRIKNAIDYGATGYVNLNEQNDYGFEIEPTLKLNDKLSIRGFYAFVDGEVTTKNDSDQDTTFYNLIRRPKNSLGLNVGYQLTKNLFTSINFKTFGDREDKFFDTSDYTSKLVNLAGYQLLDLYIEYRLAENKVRLFVDAKNILNQNYMEVYGYSTMKFNINTGVSFKF